MLSRCREHEVGDGRLLHPLLVVFLCEVDFGRDDNEESTAEKSITKSSGSLWRYDGTQSGGGHVGEHNPAGWYILWLKMRVRVVDDSVHVGVGTD